MKYIISLSSLVAFGAAIVFSISLFTSSVVAAPFASVELGISETSPRGEAGGLAMPASGSSVNLQYKRDIDSTWLSASPGIISTDEGIDLRWQKSGGTSDLDDCIFTSGYKAPSGTVIINGDSDGPASDRYLSATGNGSTYTISCIDNHDDAGHTGVAYSDTDTVVLMLETACNDGVDNDGDTLVDTDDPGCGGGGGGGGYDPHDDDEADDSPEMTLEACDSGGVCVGSGETLTIDALDVVTLNWTSENTDFCDSVGTFSMPSGSPTSGTDVNIVEPSPGDTIDYIVACGNSGVAQIARTVSVRLPQVQIIPYPSPPIIPSGGMSSEDPATVELIYDLYPAEYCELSGPEGDFMLDELIASGDLVADKYEVTLKEQGETTYVLSCQQDTDGDGVADGDTATDAATFRLLPEVQET